MNGLDIAIAIAAVSAFVGGYRRGLLARIILWVCVVACVVLAAQNMRMFIGFIHDSSKPAKPFELTTVLLSALVVGRVLGGVIGAWVRNRIPTKPLRTADRFAGGAVALVGIAVTVWLITPVLSFIPGWPSGAVKSSRVALAIDKYAPIRPSALSSVRRLFENGLLPIAIDELDRRIDTGSPPTELSLPAEVESAAERLVFKVRSVGCSLESSGTGFTLDGRNIITNAHVVAGASSVTVTIDEQLVPVRVVGFDPTRDLALLALPTSKRVPIDTGLRLRHRLAKDGELAAVPGYRGGEILQMRPARVSGTSSEVGRDIYDDRKATREIVRFASLIGPGDSGSPLVAQDGAVIGVVFSIATDRLSTAFALSDVELQSFLDTVSRSGEASTGKCLRPSKFVR